jgi:predicted DNA-binding protein
MPRTSQGGTMRQTTIRMSGRMYDRLTLISARLGLPLSEVALRAILIGLDTSCDLALDKPAVEGMARYDRSPVGGSDSRTSSVPGGDY